MRLRCSGTVRGARAMNDRNVPARGLWALGLTQIVGYGTLYYSLSILAPDIARDLGWSQQRVFGALSAFARHRRPLRAHGGKMG